MKLYLARHGESDANVLKVFSNLPGKHGLTDRGREQASHLAHAMAGKGITKLWTSPLDRAIETAAIVGERLSLVPAVREELIEFNVGFLEGRNDLQAWAIYNEYTDAWIDGKREAEKMAGGECVLDIVARVWPFLNELAASQPDEIHLAITHGGLIRSVIPHVVKELTEEFRAAPHLGQAAYVLIEFDGLTWSLLEWNRTD